MAKTQVDNNKLIQLQKQIQGIPQFALNDELQKALTATKKYKKNPAVHFAAANLHLRTGNHLAAADSLKTALKLASNTDIILSNLAYVYSSLIGDDREAIKYLDKKVNLNKKDDASLMMMANCYLKLGEPDTALELLDKAMPIAKDKIRLHGMRSQCYSRLGDSDAAKKEYLSVAELHPTGIAAVGDLLAIMPNHSEEEIKTLHDDLSTIIQERPQDFRDDNHKAMTLSGLGVLSEKMGNHEQAFDYFTQANETQPQDEKAHSFKQTGEFEILRNVFDKELFENVSSQGHTSKEQIFVLGMPRSGTTLIESILGSHSKCRDYDELEFFTQQLHILGISSDPETPHEKRAENLRQNLLNAPADGFSNIAQQYIAMHGFDTLSGMMKVDKMPLNFRALGLIALFLPNAKIIHAKRHPMDICLSVYKNPLRGYNTTFANDLETLGAFYLEYAKLMHHWHEVLPLEILDVRYEDMVQNTESEAKRLITHVGLEWEDACLAARTSKRDVKTASMWQVRSEIYQSSVQKWRIYEKQLAPLLNILSEEIKAYEAE